jgi:acyl-CoA thioester hydrolase
MQTPADLAERLAQFRFSQPIAVRFNDFDLFEVVNHAVYLSYCENARFGYWQAAMGNAMSRDVLFIIAHFSMDYRRSIRWLEPVRVPVRAVALGGKSFSLEYLVLATSLEGEYLAAEGRSVQVMFDYEAGHSIPVPDHVAARLEAFEGRRLRS